MDGRSRELKRAAWPVTVRFIAEGEELRDLLVRTGKELEAAGFHAQIGAAGGPGFFFLDEGVRKQVPPGLLAENTGAEAADRIVPGVVLRSLIQDYLFRPAAVVLGPAEIAYRAQMGPLYERFGIDPPAPVPRLTATMVSGLLWKELGREGMGLEDVIADSALASRIASARWERLGRVWQREFEGKVAELIEETLAQAPFPLRSAEKKRLGEKLLGLARRMSRELEKGGGRMLREEVKWARVLEGLTGTGGTLQERIYCLLLPLFFRVDPAAIVAMADSFLDDLIDGNPSHIVYFP